MNSFIDAKKEIIEMRQTLKRHAYHEFASKKVRNLTASKVESWSKLADSLELKDQSPSFGIHTTLLHEAFGRFIDTFNSTAYDSIDAVDFAFTQKFCQEMNKDMDGENSRSDAAKDLFSGYLGKSLVEVLAYKGSTSKTDETLCVSLGSDNLLLHPSVILEMKAELGVGEDDPTMEGLAYYVFTALQGINPKVAYIAREFSVVPLLLLSIVGPYIAFNFVASGETFVLDPATPYLPCLVLPFDIPMMEKTARAFRAMKDCITSLDTFYSTLPSEISTNPRCNQLSFPYVHDFQFHGVAIEFDYDERCPDKLVFFAHITSRGTEIPQDTKIVVKFTRSYSPEAHRACWDFNQSAPRLYAYQDVPGGWKMIVMEHLEGMEQYDILWDFPRFNQLREIVNHLHSQSFVHGDLRPCNILVHPENRICLIDFDWAGQEGSVRYPAFMNSAVHWAEGVSDYKLILRSHDMFFFDLYTC